MEEYKFEGINKNKYCLKVFPNYCVLKFTYRLVMRTRLRHYCNARSSFFQSQFVSGFPSTVKLLPVKHWVHFRIFKARSLNSWGNTEISNAVSVFRLAFQCATLVFNYIEAVCDTCRLQTCRLADLQTFVTNWKDYKLVLHWSEQQVLWSVLHDRVDNTLRSPLYILRDKVAWHK